MPSANDNTMDVDTPVTRAELREELARYPTREEMRVTLREELARFATRDDLARLASELRGEFTHFANVIIEAIRAEIRASTDPYRDLPKRVEATEQERLPERVSRLEAAVFPPKPKPQRRRRG